jgi:hypothetical protein
VDSGRNTGLECEAVDARKPHLGAKHHSVRQLGTTEPIGGFPEIPSRSQLDYHVQVHALGAVITSKDFDMAEMVYG